MMESKSNSLESNGKEPSNLKPKRFKSIRIRISNLISYISTVEFMAFMLAILFSIMFLRTNNFDVTFGDYISSISFLFLALTLYLQVRVIGAKIDILDRVTEGTLFMNMKFPQFEYADIDSRFPYGSLRLDPIIFINTGDRMSIVSIISIELLKEGFREETWLSTKLDYGVVSKIVEPHKKILIQLNDIQLWKKEPKIQFNEIEEIRVKFEYTFRNSALTKDKIIKVKMNPVVNSEIPAPITV